MCCSESGFKCDVFYVSVDDELKKNLLRAQSNPATFTSDLYHARPRVDSGSSGPRRVQGEDCSETEKRG